jgi:aldehyde:ferredoxin oxidoreductase
VTAQQDDKKGEAAMANGYMGKILRINLSEGKIKEENLREDWAQKFIGGAGLATRHEQKTPCVKTSY